MSPPEPRPVTVIFDTSAIFTRQSIHVGELLAEVDEEGGAAGLPVTCLVEAVHAVHDTGRLDVLVNHRATVLLADKPADGLVLATAYDVVGRQDAASAILGAIDHDCAVLTRRPGLYAGLDGTGGRILTIDG